MVLEVLQASPGLMIGVAVVFGCFIGSFLNVVIHRLPLMMEREWKQQCEELMAQPPPPQPSPAQPQGREKEKPYNLVVPRSACPSCGALIRAHQNIPVLSYLWLRGQCGSCKAKISIRYPIIELLTGILTAAVVWRFGLTWETVGALILTWSLVALSAIDIDTQLLPDSITLPLLWLGLLFSLTWVGETQLAIPASMRGSIIGATAGYLSLWSVYKIFKLLTGKEGMGYGDFKLFAAFGAWFGWQMLPLIILLSAFTGAAIGIALILLRRQGREVPIPFGPYLAAAGWIALMWGPQIVERYLHIARL
jgi:leader peptidase (prepilin peptidase)/N-methyltransferase